MANQDINDNNINKFLLHSYIIYVGCAGLVNKSLISTWKVSVIGIALLFECLFICCLLLNCQKPNYSVLWMIVVYDFQLACTSHWFTANGKHNVT